MPQGSTAACSYNSTRSPPWPYMSPVPAADDTTGSAPERQGREVDLNHRSQPYEGREDSELLHPAMLAVYSDALTSTGSRPGGRPEGPTHPILSSRPVRPGGKQVAPAIHRYGTEPAAVVVRSALTPAGPCACLPEGLTPTSGFSTGPLVFGSGWPGIPGAPGASRPVARARTWNLRFWRPPRYQLRYHRSRTERSDRNPSSFRSLQPNSRRNSPWPPLP